MRNHPSPSHRSDAERDHSGPDSPQHEGRPTNRAQDDPQTPRKLDISSSHLSRHNPTHQQVHSTEQQAPNEPTQ